MPLQSTTTYTGTIEEFANNDQFVKELSDALATDESFLDMFTDAELIDIIKERTAAITEANNTIRAATMRLCRTEEE